jgi:hypothetical protein
VVDKSIARGSAVLIDEVVGLGREDGEQDVESVRRLRTGESGSSAVSFEDEVAGSTAVCHAEVSGTCPHFGNGKRISIVSDFFVGIGSCCDNPGVIKLVTAVNEFRQKCVLA